MEALRKDHFAFFSLAPVFGLDAAALEAAYRNVQSTVHPDRFASAGQAERRYAMQLATRANEAYRTLSSPLERAAYLCQLNGIDVGSEDNTAMPPEFLMGQMQWREALEAAIDASDQAGVQALLADTAQEREALCTRLSDAIDERGDFEAAATLVRQFMFLDRFAKQVRSASQSLTARE